MSRHDRATVAAIATGWIEDETPEKLHPGLLGRVEHWLAAGDLPSAVLWRSLLDILRRCGCLDAEAAACRMALSLDPAQPFFRLRLAECLWRIGEDEEARALLLGITETGPARAAALVKLLGMDGGEAVAAELETLLLGDGRWGERQSSLVRHLAGKGETARAARFLEAWTDRWTVAPSDLMDLGVMAMLVGNPAKARALFAPLWRDAPEEQTRVVGRFRETLVPYDETVESGLLARIETAFALPDDQLAVLAPPCPAGGDWRRPVMLLSFGDRDLVNDLAAHLAGSAAAAGVELHLHLDSALCLPVEFRGTDSEVERRLAGFEEALARHRPEVVVVDCASPLYLRGINPGVMAGLKHRFGFRLVAMMRDAHRYAMPILSAWLPAVDAMVVFDPGSPVFADQHKPGNAKVIALPVPSMHGPFLERSDPPDLGLSFAGSVNFLARHALLAVLMTEDIDFTAVIGHRRTILTPDMASYARLLRRSKAVLNISAHSPEDHLVTGRVWETVAAGSLLVEQANPATARFLTPWRHYLPWSDVDDIVHVARLVGRRPDIAARVAAEAHAWACRHYGSERFWQGLIGHAWRPRDESGLAAELEAARNWTSVTLG